MFTICVRYADSVWIPYNLVNLISNSLVKLASFSYIAVFELFLYPTLPTDNYTPILYYVVMLNPIYINSIHIVNP